MSDDAAADDWRADLAQHREEKDRFLGEHPQSPLPPDARERFDGLDCYAPNPDLRFEVPLHEHDGTERVTVETTTEGEQTYLRWGEFRVTIEGETVALQAYRADPDEDRFWLPFRDETSGDETYGAGRYLDLDESDRTEEGDWLLDFNRAYTPFCAYSAAYECPLVPMENWLDVPVEAGEKTYEGPTGDGSHHH
jgi:uncharacterized protein (DUF1684 family)